MRKKSLLSQGAISYYSWMDSLLHQKFSFPNSDLQIFVAYSVLYNNFDAYLNIQQ